MRLMSGKYLLNKSFFLMFIVYWFYVKSSISCNFIINDRVKVVVGIYVFLLIVF